MPDEVKLVLSLHENSDLILRCRLFEMSDIKLFHLFYCGHYKNLFLVKLRLCIKGDR